MYMLLFQIKRGKLESSIRVHRDTATIPCVFCSGDQGRWEFHYQRKIIMFYVMTTVWERGYRNGQIFLRPSLINVTWFLEPTWMRQNDLSTQYWKNILNHKRTTTKGRLNNLFSDWEKKVYTVNYLRFSNCINLD